MAKSSVFTFESNVHPSHVLLWLDEQRRRDTFCDVTLVVQGQSFRAHRVVLASCSEYFSQRTSALAQPGAVLTLPLEVTAAGFEPLLKFAYTSKLLFSKDDVLDIRNSASILGFKDLDEACFDFLIPKFQSAPFPRKTCCKKICKTQLSKEDRDADRDSDDVFLDEKEEEPVADSSFQQEVALACNKTVNTKLGSQNGTSTITPVPDQGTNDCFMQCPKYRKFQIACGKESCLTEKRLKSSVTVISNDCESPSTPRSSSANTKNESEFLGNTGPDPSTQSKAVAHEPWQTETHDMKVSEVLDVVKEETNGQWNEKETDMQLGEDICVPDSSFVKAVFSTAPCQMSSGLISHHWPLKTLGEDPAISGSQEHKRLGMDITEGEKTRTSIRQQTSETMVETEQKMADNEINCDWQERGKVEPTYARERSTVEREVAEHLAKRLGSDLGRPDVSFHEPDAGSSSDTGSGWGASLDCLNVNLSNTSAGCPCFPDLDKGKWRKAELSEGEGASQSGVSSLNSGEDEDRVSETETEGDSEPNNRERALQMKLPCSLDWIVDLSRNEFQQLLRRQVFTREQLDFVHDMRRRCKNRLAAQRCRKRKLDCIYNLQCEINKLKTERERLMTEKSQLSQMKTKTCHSVSALCQRVCSEAHLRPEQLQVLAKYTSPDCPLASFFPNMDALLLSPQLREALASASPAAAGLDLRHPASEEEKASCSSGRETVHTGDHQR